MREFVYLGAAEVVLVEGAAVERAGPAAAHEAEAVVEEGLAKLFAAEGPESAAATERDWQKTKMPDVVPKNSLIIWLDNPRSEAYPGIWNVRLICTK